MQYSRPVQKAGDDLFWGDPMPFYHEGVFHLFILLDHGHHADKGGLGGHQWAHFATTDLIHWEAHPLAVPVGEPGSCDQYGICTGSTFYHDGIYYAFYATRKATGEGWSKFLTEQLCFATSRDGIHFTKDPGNPLADPAPGYGTDYRDPCVFRDPTTGLFHMLVTARRKPEAAFSRGGCLAHLTSGDLRHWELQQPFLEHHHLGNAPECSDWFGWNGWYYLLFAHEGMARYRMSRTPLGPWTRPPHDTFEGPMASVMKTAAWKGHRRLGAAFVPWRTDGKDNGARAYAGNVVFRELVQHPDGTLHVKFVPEMIPPSEAPLAWEAESLIGQMQAQPSASIALRGNPGTAIAALHVVPVNARISLQVKPEPGTPHFGFCLRAQGCYEQGYELRFSPYEQRVSLRNIRIPTNQVGDASSELRGVMGLDAPFSLDIVMTDDILDVCLADRHCLINRFPEVRGESLFLFCEDGGVEFSELTVRALCNPPQPWFMQA
jgi:beta-fructofuranosidase